MCPKASACPCFFAPWAAVPVCYLKTVFLDMPRVPLCAGFLSSADTSAWSPDLPLPSSTDTLGGGRMGLGLGGRDGRQCGWGKEALK